MSVSLKPFQADSVHIFDDIKYCNGKICCAWIVPVPFSLLSYIDDLWCMQGDSTPRTVQLARGRKENLEFLQTIVLDIASNLKQQDVMCINKLERSE